MGGLESTITGVLENFCQAHTKLHRHMLESLGTVVYGGSSGSAAPAEPSPSLRSGGAA